MNSLRIEHGREVGENNPGEKVLRPVVVGKLGEDAAIEEGCRRRKGGLGGRACNARRRTWRAGRCDGSTEWKVECRIMLVARDDAHEV